MTDIKYLAQIASVALVAVLVIITSVLLAIGIFQSQTAYVYLALSMICFMLPAMVGLRNLARFDPFEPINIIAAGIFFSVTIRAFYVTGYDTQRTEFVMMGQSFDGIIANSPLIVVGILSLCLGYIVINSRYSIEDTKVLRFFRLDYRRSWVAIILFTFLGLLGTVLFINNFGISIDADLLSQSVKRNTVLIDDNGEAVYGTGYEVFLARMASYALIFLSALFLTRSIKISPIHLFALGIVIILTITMPFLSSSRSKIIFPLLTIITFAFYWRRVSLKFVLATALAISIIMVGMGFLRASNQSGSQREASIEFIVGATNGLDLARSAAIIERVPENHDYLYGTSYLALLTSPIPRSIWVEKPNPSLGAWVKGELFGYSVKKNGWPPGMIAEAYVNFGVFGVPAIMFALGGLMRWSYETFRPLLGVDFPATLIWCSCLWDISWDMFGLNFAQGVLQTLQFFFPMLIILLIAKRSKRMPVRVMRRV